MRLQHRLIGARGTAAVLLAGAVFGFAPDLLPAAAQAAEVCSEPRQPRIPRGISVQRREMEDAERDLANYLHQNRLFIGCLERAIRRAEQDAGKLSNEFTRQIDIYNSRSP